MLSGLVVAALLGAPAQDVTLKGYVLARSEGLSVAVLASGGRTRVAAIGDIAFGGRLVSVTREGAMLEFGADRVLVRLPATAEPPGPSRVAQAAGTEPPIDPETPPRNMARADVDRRLSLEMNRILAETALAPVVEDGRVTGVSLTRVAAGSLLTEAGLKTGDVLTEINGTKIDGLATLMGLYGRLQSEKELRAVVLRGGKSISLKVSLQ
jgi:general secretion pathway protein C